mmetsp:Transcript_20019/g.31793  ORF Transcript_20019/g.31793 Transcript_20019/m.31793 type:complete len:212 (-) Transcript_20019:712-1347(-)
MYTQKRARRHAYTLISYDLISEQHTKRKHNKIQTRVFDGYFAIITDKHNDELMIGHIIEHIQIIAVIIGFEETVIISNQLEFVFEFIKGSGHRIGRVDKLNQDNAVPQAPQNSLGGRLGEGGIMRERHPIPQQDGEDLEEHDHAPQAVLFAQIAERLLVRIVDIDKADLPMDAVERIHVDVLHQLLQIEQRVQQNHAAAKLGNHGGNLCEV